jgi:ATP-binding cassette subfamily F protein uup
MALINLLNITKKFDIKLILDKVSVHINEGDRISVIGKNGAGKSTLMKIVAKQLEPDDGDMFFSNNLQISILDQNPDFPENITVRKAIEFSLTEIRRVRKRYDEVSELLTNDFDNQELLNEHAKLTTYLDHHSAWDLDNQIERILVEFALKSMENRSVESLSGGEQRRVALAGLLLQKPDVLLLDEPTNHLDVYMVEFLENLLLKNKFTLLFISHDRYFIDRIATRSIEVEDGKIREFKGGYADYLSQKNMLLANLQKQHETLLKILKHEEEWYSRGVRARLKRNEGRKERLMDLREQSKKNPSLIRKMHIELEREQKNFTKTKSENRQRMLFEIHDISKKLGDKIIIKDFNYRILQKDRIAIVGRNGTGKSTLLQMFLDRMKVDSGKIKRGEFKIGYFDQQKEMLKDDKNLIQTFCPDGGDRVNVRGSNMHVYGYLKQFLFPKEYLDKPVGVLSGGEKSRVALALLFTQDIDCLILDEPTNDLDIATINILEEQLVSFKGAIILVSHDRYFVDKIAEKLLILKGRGEFEESYSNYSEYLEIEKELHELDLLEAEVSTSSETTEAQEKPKVQEIKKQQKQQKLSYKEKQILETYPKKIEKLEDKIEELNNCLADPKCYQEHGISKVAEDLEKLNSEYDEILNIYLEVEEKNEELS